MHINLFFFFKVSILESSNAAMAEDILQKQAIIEHYVKEGRPGRAQLSHTLCLSNITMSRVITLTVYKTTRNNDYSSANRMKILQK